MEVAYYTGEMDQARSINGPIHVFATVFNIEIFVSILRGPFGQNDWDTLQFKSISEIKTKTQVVSHVGFVPEERKKNLEIQR